MPSAASSQSQFSGAALSTQPFGWNLYFPETDYDRTEGYVENIFGYMNYFNTVNLPRGEIDKSGAAAVDWVDLLAQCRVADVKEMMSENPARELAAMGVAIYEVLYANQDFSGDNSQGQPASMPRKINVRVTNFGPETGIRQLKSHCIGKFVSVRGTVVRVSAIRPLVVSMEFICGKCDAVMLRRFTEGKYNPPHGCETTGCRSKYFMADRSSAVTVDWQKIRLQEVSSDDAGRIPRSMEVTLTADLIDGCVPGDIVLVGGIIKMESTESAKGKASKDKTLFFLYMEGNSLSNACKSNDSSNVDVLQFSLKDMYLIQDIASQPELFHLIVNSVCPSIYGHECVKAGLALALFGGSRQHEKDANRLSIRGESHVLVVGDPGLGKSQMLRSAANLAPRGVYVSGNTATTTGLTVTLLKDPVTGDYALEAGALVLGDQGVCCVDEFDKMGTEHHAFLEAMEQQCVSIAKAGIVANLPARTAVLAAANPVGGHYNLAKTVNENLKMGPALLSRFDLIFILMDKPDEDLDARLSDHIMMLHGGGRGTRSRSRPVISNGDEGREEWTNSRPLRQRLKDRGTVDPIPAMLLRKYIGYARKYVNPQLSSDACAVLQKFYLTLRARHMTSDATPITTRQLESLVRLAVARAKVELREVVTEQDAKDVVELMKESLIDTCADEFGQIDFQRATGMSKRTLVKKFVASLHRSAEERYNSLFTTEQLYKTAQEIGVPPQEFQDLVEKLNQQTYLLKKGRNVWQLASSSVASGGFTPN